MKKNFFKKSMSAILALMMILSVLATLPISIAAEDDLDSGEIEEEELAEAKLTPYHLADDGDLLYQVNFHGDTAFQPDRILGWVGNQMLGDTHQYIVSEDGSEMTTQGDASISGSRFHYWGGKIEGLEAGTDKYYTMVYKVKPLDRVDADGNSKSVGMNNSFSVGGWASDPEGCVIYANYGNYGSIDRDADGNPLYDTDSDTRRTRINLQQTGIGKIYTGKKATQPDYTYFKDLEKADTEIMESRPLIGEDGYMTVMVEYDAPNNEIRSYYLLKGTGQDKSDWQQVQKAEFAHASMNPDLSDDCIGYWTFASYHVVNQSIKDVRYYKGAYCQVVQQVEIGTAEELAALNETLNDPAYAEAKKARVMLTADIDMTDVAYTPVSTTKSVQFNGQGHKISNLSVASTTEAPVEAAGLFATAAAGSSFRNVTLENVNMVAETVAAAVIATPAAGDLTISNVSVMGNVEAGLIAGGFVGFNEEAATTAAAWNISYCSNAATVKSSMAAGIVAYAYGTINLDLSYCSNTGAITATGYAAGIANLIDAEGSGEIAITGKIANTYNTGKLTATATEGQTFAGGIVGAYAVAENEENTLSFYNCFDASEKVGAVNNGVIAGYVAGTAVSFENTYGVGAADAKLVAQYEGEATAVTSGVVEAASTKCELSTGSIKLEKMIDRLATAIASLAEVEMPMGGFNDGKDRDYTWYYKDGALVEAGTKENPYVIANAAQFATLSALSNGFHDPDEIGGSEDRVNFNGKYFKLTGNVDLDGYLVDPLNMKDATIFFEGGNNTISNWTITNAVNGGMFSAVGRYSTVQNLKLDNVDVTGTDTSAVVIAQAKAGLTVYNVTVSDTCSVAAGDGDLAGGIVGIVDDEKAGYTETKDGDVVTQTVKEEDTIKISFCINAAPVSAEKQVGGIIGRIFGSINYQIFYCANKGDVSIVSEKGGDRLYVGGILGYTDYRNDSAFPYVDSFISNSYNTGKLTTVDTTSYCYVGGIAGYLNATANTEVSIKQCYDLSARQVSTKSEGTMLSNVGIGASAGSNVVKFVDISYAANADGSMHPYTSLNGWRKDSNAQTDTYSNVVKDGDAEILDGNGEASTIKAEMLKIDEAIANTTAIEWDWVDPNPVEEETEAPETTAPETTEAPATEAETTDEDEAPKKKGCKSTLNSAYAVVALVAVVGFAFVAKKREEN